MILLTIWGSLAQALPLQGRHRCATMEVLPTAPPPIFEVPSTGKSGKQERDSVCDCSNELYSDNFVVKWGSGVSEADAQAVLEHFEYAWEIEHEQMGYEAPVGTEQYYFNVYIGDTGGGTPGSYGAAGYFTIDDQGYPLIVLAKSTLESPDYLHTTISHEFFHALQGATDRYGYDTLSAGSWYWEATANWIESYVYPNDVGVAGFLLGYVFFPHYPVNYFNYPDEGILDEYHQYGAFIFPLHLTDIDADPELIRSSWQDSGNENDPMEVLDRYLVDYGTTIEESWLDHIARLTIMDYEQGDAYEQWLDYYADWYPESENRIATEVMQEGSDGWRDGPASLQPMRFGHNTIKASGLIEDSVTFAVRGEEAGSSGSTAEYGARLVRVRNGNIQYYPVEFDGVEGSITQEDVSSGDTYYFVIGVWTDQWQENRVYSEVFPYQFYIGSENPSTVEPSAEPSEEPSEPGDDSLGPGSIYEDGKDGFDCQGCSSAQSSSNFWGLLCFTLGISLYRRRSSEV